MFENMRLFLFTILFYLHYGETTLWSKGVVHFAINNKDYDPHSQEIIFKTLENIEKEICVKFFRMPIINTMVNNERILYITNPDKRKDCPPGIYDYNKTVVDMPVGYKCLNEDDISGIVLDMLRASIAAQGCLEEIAVCDKAAHYKPNSNDLYKTFQKKEKDEENSDTLLTASDRNFINTHYLEECGEFIQKPVSARRSFGSKKMSLSEENVEYYKNKLWPFGIVMYEIDKTIKTPEEDALEHAMQVIELATCIVFQRIPGHEPIQPKNLVYFGLEGEEVPHLGLLAGNQSIIVSSMLNGAPGHSGHTLSLLMRILGIPMMSNRYDRTNYVRINWDRVATTKEHYLERAPDKAWLKGKDDEGSAYDFDSVTHAPANYMCADCSRGEQTVTPIQDYLWQRTLTMGHRTHLSTADIDMLNVLYNEQCQKRFTKSETDSKDR